MKIGFTHRQSSHCESGVISNLLSHYGLNVSEALAFGIGSGLFFGYIPFIRLNQLPLTTFRSPTGGIIKKVTQRLGVRIQKQAFRDPVKAMEALDDKLEEGIPVGCQTGGYWLPYFPQAYRFHFNMHNLMVYGKENNEYLISDPVFPDPVTIASTDLLKARFAKGALAPRGKMYYLTKMPVQTDLTQAIVQGIKDVCKTMLKNPFPILGVRGIHYLAKQVEKWPDKLGKEKSLLYLGQVIRMQEEIGTGGGGFRFIFAAFLQEAAEILDNNDLFEISEQVTETGDHWRQFAMIGARNCKGRARKEDSFQVMAGILRECSVREKKIYADLLKAV